MGEDEGDKMSEAPTIRDWIKVNRHVRYLENIENEIRYVIYTNEYREYATNDLDRNLKAALMELSREIDHWTAVRNRIRDSMKDEVEQSKNNG